MQSIVVVGAGEAGARAALALRENGFSGRVTLVGAEAHPPYERPPLSKAALLDDAEPEPRTILRAAEFGEAGVVHLARATATGIDRAGHRLQLADGRALAYDRLLLATGATARPLALPGAAETGVLTLRGFPDALALRAALQPGRRIIVIGGGFIGLELAAAAVVRGATVTLVELAPRLLARAVPAPLAALIAARHEAAGVRILTGTGIAELRRDGAERLVVLATGETLAADTVIAGIGALPETALAASAGLALDNGIAVDATLASGDPDIFAAGDCCSFPHPLYGGRRIRLEAWRNAQDQGNTAARNLLGAAEPHAAVPWFWSDQYELTLQIAGLPDEGVETVTRDLGTARLDFHRAADGRLVAVSALGPNAAIAKEVRLAEMLIARRAAPDAASLAAPAVRLKTLLA